MLCREGVTLNRVTFAELPCDVFEDCHISHRAVHGNVHSPALALQRCCTSCFGCQQHTMARVATMLVAAIAALLLAHGAHAQLNKTQAAAVSEYFSCSRASSVQPGVVKLGCFQTLCTACSMHRVSWIAFMQLACKRSC